MFVDRAGGVCRFLRYLVLFAWSAWGCGCESVGLYVLCGGAFGEYLGHGGSSGTVESAGAFAGRGVYGVKHCRVVADVWLGGDEAGDDRYQAVDDGAGGICRLGDWRCTVSFAVETAIRLDKLPKIDW